MQDQNSELTLEEWYRDKNFGRNIPNPKSFKTL